MSVTPVKADTFLFVDDETSILSAIRRELHEWAKERSLRIVTASSAREGLGILEGKSEEIAVIVSDLKMPEMRGSDFLLEVKDRWPSIVTILLTGFSETAEVMKAIKAGIFSYILKPWESEYLQSELSKAYEVFSMRAQNRLYLKTIEDELKWAGEMQRAILKPSLLHSNGVEFRTSYRPVPGLYCGGDYYDVLCLSPERYLVLLGDVAGHGVRAAFITGILKAIIYPEYVRNLTVAKRFSPAAFLAWLNDRMNFELRRASNLMITFFAGLIDVEEKTFVYANAGQCHPFILRGGKSLELPISGSGIGFASSVLYTEKAESLLSGDVIILYTDGLIEPGAKEGKTAVVNMSEVLDGLAYGPEFHRRIMETALAAGDAEQFEDDVTILTARLQ
jgi:sigma-B regulation protein RsbU (phosphoserine phosphatase)